MLRKLLVSAVFVLSATAAIAAERASVLPLDSTAANPGAVAVAQAPFAASVLDLPVECVRPQKAAAGFDPDVCSQVCSNKSCRGKALYESCGGSNVCYPIWPACSDGLPCGCGLAR